MSAPPSCPVVEPIEAEAFMNNVVVVRVQSPTFQISARIREMIHDGNLTPGMKLPPTRSLASQLSVDPTAVHRSLAQLVKEGLLTRTPRVGTFVTAPPSTLKRIAFYYRPVAAGYFSNFERAILTEVTRIGHKSGFAVEVFSDTRRLDISKVEPHPNLLRHTRTRWVQGVISGGVSPESVKWFNSLTVPRATVSTPTEPHTFFWGREETVAMAVRQLAARGCRKIGMITALRAHADPKATPYELGLYRGFCDTVKQLDLPLNPSRLVGQAPGGKVITELDMPAFGFDAFNRMWDQPDRPDGLFIFPDILASGVLMAIAMRGVRIPQDLQLVIHANAELPIFCPFPVDRLVYRASDAATAMVGHIRDQLANRETAKRALSAHIEAHP